MAKLVKLVKLEELGEFERFTKLAELKGWMESAKLTKIGSVLESDSSVDSQFSGVPLAGLVKEIAIFAMFVRKI